MRDRRGARSTLIGAGMVGGAVTLAALYLPGMRAVERSDVRTALAQTADRA